MKYFFKYRRRLVLKLLCLILLVDVVLTGGLKSTPSDDDIRLFAYPENYIKTMSSTPGIRISVKFVGKVHKVRYSTAYGAFLRWNSASGKIIECGQRVELPYDYEIYWTPSRNNSIANETDIISIKIGILDENERLLAEKEVNFLINEGLYSVQKSPGVQIGVKEVYYEL